VGDAVPLCAEILRGADVELVPPPYPEITARHVAQIAARAWSRGEGVAAADLVPRYLRRAEAEVKRTGLRFEPL
jgi:hypothetical protein